MDIQVYLKDGLKYVVLFDDISIVFKSSEPEDFDIIYEDSKYRNNAIKCYKKFNSLYDDKIIIGLSILKNAMYSDKMLNFKKRLKRKAEVFKLLRCNMCDDVSKMVISYME